ncbi:hypothetical protein [Streptomyces sp. NPDC057877]|uniref:hypothetical protein n=1 Tax=Streptomyces sp. NPDC057877 TaxID=3346269 RepID=UPI0036A6463B
MSNTSLNGTGALSVADACVVTRSEATLKSLIECSFDVGCGLIAVRDRLASAAISSKPTRSQRKPSLLGFASFTAPCGQPGARTRRLRTQLQTADLNAVLAVIRWRRSIGIYADATDESHTTYSLITNEIANEDLTKTIGPPSWTLGADDQATGTLPAEAFGLSLRRRYSVVQRFAGQLVRARRIVQLPLGWSRRGVYTFSAPDSSTW